MTGEKMSVNILIVDDDKQNRTVISRLLQKTGFNTETAEDAKSAIEKLSENVYQLVITDKNMPGIDRMDEGGMDVLKFIRDTCPDVMVMMMTGYATVDTAIEAMKLGAFDYITKPFVMKDLVGKIHRVIGYRQFINCDNIIENYKAIQDEALSLIVNRGPSADVDRQHELISAFNDKLDMLFDRIKKQEEVVVEQRDALTNICSFAEQVLENVDDDTSEIGELVNMIYQEARKRV